MIMLNHRLVIRSLWMVPLLLSTLACNAAAQWINPDTPNTLSPTSSQSSSEPPVFSPPTTTAASEAACPALLTEILNSSSHDAKGGLSALFAGESEVRYLVVYSLDEDTLGPREDLILPGHVNNDLDSRASHEYIWNYFAALIPPEERTFVTEFSILSDGKNNILAGVSPTYDDPSNWTLKMDVVDAEDPHVLTYTLLHEFGHFLTLKPSQVPPDSLVFYHPDDQAIYEQAVAACPRYFTGEGCSNPGSYIDEFFNRFWSSFYDEWQEVTKTSGEDSYTGSLNDFYNLYRDQFLSEYAPTSPEEDIAESWTHFLLAPKPEPTSIADQKILFFYEYPELVELRAQILSSVCTNFPQK